MGKIFITRELEATREVTPDSLAAGLRLVFALFILYQVEEGEMDSYFFGCKLLT
jgi:hypothetical protein